MNRRVDELKAIENMASRPTGRLVRTEGLTIKPRVERIAVTDREQTERTFVERYAAMPDSRKIEIERLQQAERDRVDAKKIANMSERELRKFRQDAYDINSNKQGGGNKQ